MQFEEKNGMDNNDFIEILSTIAMLHDIQPYHSLQSKYVFMFHYSSYHYTNFNVWGVKKSVIMGDEGYINFKLFMNTRGMTTNWATLKHNHKNIFADIL